MRVLGDRNLLTTLQLESFAGPVWDTTEEELARYALSVLTAWIATLEIFAKRREKAFKPLLYPPNPGSTERDALREDAADLAAMLVSESLPTFHTKVLLPGGWIPEKGASITTYFIGWCLFQFNTVLRAWQTQRKHEGPLRTATEFHVERHDGKANDPLRTLVDRDAARRALGIAVSSSRRRSTKDQTATILPLLACGLRQAEVAALIGTSERAVEGHMARLRKRLSEEDFA